MAGVELEQIYRSNAIERGPGAQEGRFSGVLASSGEAEDGHIIDVKGIEIPDHVPLMIDHGRHTVTKSIGSWERSAFRKTRDGLLRGTAVIETEGTGAEAELRRDVALMVTRGHLKSFSAGIVPTERPVARVNLPKDHPAFVDAAESEGPQRYGVFLAKSRLEEGSIVSLGADRGAVIGRAASGPEAVRELWAEMLDGDDLDGVLTRAHELIDLAETLGATESQIIEQLQLPAAQVLTGEWPDPETEPQPLTEAIQRLVEEQRARAHRPGGLVDALKGMKRR